MNKKLKVIVLFGISAIAMQFFFGEKLIAAASPRGEVMYTNINQDGLPINDAAMIGRQYAVFNNSTTETLICTGVCVLDGIFIASGTATDYLIVADTTAVNGTGTAIFPHIYFPGAGKNLSALSGFPPIKSTIGLTVDASATGAEVVIAYHKQ